MLQMEIMRSNIDRKICMVRWLPKEATEHRKAEKHLQIRLPCNVSGRTLSLQLSYIRKEPARGMFTNYIFVFQRVGSDNNMENICLAYCKQMQKKNGAIFVLGRDFNDKLSDLKAGTTIYARQLVNCSMWKTHMHAIISLKQAEECLRTSHVMRQLLRGRIDHQDIKKIKDLDTWVSSKPTDTGGGAVDLKGFNKQQQRALALDALTSTGLVLIQGPPGTGKSHIICHGILPQAVSRNERVLVVCNSNVAVDALMLKCLKDDIACVKDKVGRCGFKESVSDDIVNLGLFLEGGISSACDQYGNTPGANSNTVDSTVQTQICSAQIIFTTIHYASKEKAKSTISDDYWRFDTLVLDEAAQIEDAKLMIVLARCPSLNKMILVGDPKQLQPYVPDSLRNQHYGRSTMERVMDASKNADGFDSAPHVMLERQFRMAPPLRSIVSHLYYDGRLQDDDCVKEYGPVTRNVDLKPLLVVN
ncbi:hypothetical protein ACHAXR_004188, partial [Thalassiosira sp. AJA248-18]